MKNLETKPNKRVFNVMIVDRSGSMGAVRETTLNSLNQQIEQMKKDEIENNVDMFNTIMLFDTRLGTWFDYIQDNSPVSKCNTLSLKDYEPSGGTPLLDAIYEGITHTENSIKDFLNDDIKIFFTIFTDGEENSSIKYNHGQVNSKINELTDTKKWVFSFIGSGGIKEVQKISKSFGILEGNTLSFEGTNDMAVCDAFSTVMKSRSMYVSRYSNNINCDTSVFNKNNKE